MQHRGKFYYDRLSALEQGLYSRLYSGLSGGACTAQLALSGSERCHTDMETLIHVTRSVIDDNPQLFHLTTARIDCARMGNTAIVRLEPVYTREEYRRLSGELSRLVAQILSRLNRCASDLDRLRLIHGFLSGIMRYDDGGTDRRRSIEAHTIVGAVINRSCVCDGYSRLFCLLCRLVQIPCMIVTGDSTQRENPGPHAWNMVALQGAYYHVDATWDSRETDFYFLRSDAFFALEHRWDKKIYPAAPADYPRSEYLAADERSLEAYVCQQLRDGVRTFSVRLPGNHRGLEALRDQLQRIANRHPLRFANVAGWEINWYEHIRCARITLTGADG